MAPDIACPATLPVRRPLAGRHVLLVEDEALIAMMLEEALADAGCAVTAVGEGSLALAVASAPATPRIDALVVDRGLPDMDGAEVGDRLRAVHPRLPVLFATGFALYSEEGISALADERGDDVRGRTPGPTAVLVKPFDPARLVAMLARLIDTAEHGSTGLRAGRGGSDTVHRPRRPVIVRPPIPLGWTIRFGPASSTRLLRFSRRLHATAEAQATGPTARHEVRPAG